MAAAAKEQLESDRARGYTSSPVEAALTGHDSPQSPHRLRWRITGQVQGVGLRPYVYRLAMLLRLSGFVHNDERGVVIEAQGPGEALDALERRLRDQPPPLCRVDGIVRRVIQPRPDERGFSIRTSPAPSADAAADTPVAGVTPDAAVCDDCLRELFDPAPGNRRHRYPLINCTHCGPRYTIVRRVPYDRPNTTMARFAMCEPCAAEYADPADRRFHAQPTACPACGPRLQLVDSHGLPLDGEPISQAAAMLRDRAIVAVKGLGGFHLCCRADDAGVVTRLRQLKNRDAKPFALMVRDLPTAERLVRLSNVAIDAMRSPACPIVLAERMSDSTSASGDGGGVIRFSGSGQLRGAPLAAEVAPGMHRLGVMLPYTPVHHLLFACEQTPAVLVMTSANLSDEPLVRDNDEALSRLSHLCDAMLLHDRPIHRAVDDSVFIDFGDNEPLLPVRRARGYTPQPIALSIPSSLSPSVPQSLPSGLCLGGELKNTIAVVRDGQAILSHHLGDLKHPAALANFKQAVTDLCDLARVTPKWIAHDLHPAYLSTLHAQHLSRQWGVPLFAVQHHHAHAAAVLAEHQHQGPALAVVCDGVGYAPGSPGNEIWGGELLLAGYTGFERLAHLRPLKLAGGDAAAIDTRRSAMALLQQVIGDRFAAGDEAAALYADFEQRHAIAAMLDHNVRTVATTAAGRYFDAVAALLGLAAVNQFEAQAAMALEAAAAHAAPVQSANDTPLFRLQSSTSGGGGPTQIDLAPLIARILELGHMGHDRSALAWLFHEQFALAFADAVAQASQQTGIRVVALSGGCFCNQRLTARMTHHLQSRGLLVLRHTLVPPGDGSIALGQAAVASALFGGTH
ncbi:MAG: carbamoyltransferase HypF [Phycisphaerales bacterium]